MCVGQLMQLSLITGNLQHFIFKQKYLNSPSIAVKYPDPSWMSKYSI